MEKQTLTIGETAVLLGVAPHTAYRAAKRGEIPTIRIGGRLLVPKAAMAQLLVGTIEQDTAEGGHTESAKQPQEAKVKDT